MVFHPPPVPPSLKYPASLCRSSCHEAHPEVNSSASKTKIARRNNAAPYPPPTDQEIWHQDMLCEVYVNSIFAPIEPRGPKQRSPGQSSDCDATARTPLRTRDATAKIVCRLESLASVQGLFALGQGQPGDSVEDFTGESVSLGGLGVLGVGLDFEQKVTKQTKELRKSQPVSAIRWGTDAILRSVGNTSTGSILEPREARIATKIATHVLFLVLPS